MTCSCLLGSSRRARTRRTASSGTTLASGIGWRGSGGARLWSRRPSAWWTSASPCSPASLATTGSATCCPCYLCTPKTLWFCADGAFRPSRSHVPLRPRCWPHSAACSATDSSSASPARAGQRPVTARVPALPNHPSMPRTTVEAAGSVERLAGPRTAPRRARSGPVLVEQLASGVGDRKAGGLFRHAPNRASDDQGVPLRLWWRSVIQHAVRYHSGGLCSPTPMPTRAIPRRSMRVGTCRSTSAPTTVAVAGRSASRSANVALCRRAIASWSQT
jgi:hypothetical protein